MVVIKNLNKFKYMLLSSTLMLPLSVQAANFGPGGTTLTNAYTNTSGSTINSQGFLTMSGSGAVFTNNSGAVFNNTGFQTTLKDSGAFKNSGTADLGDVSILSGG